MDDQYPQVYKAVRAIGIIRPKFQPEEQKVFADSLKVIGTAFWLKNYEVMITCAHVIGDLIGAPLEITGLLVVGKKGNYERAFVDTIDLPHDLAVLRLSSRNEEEKEKIRNEAQEGLEIIDHYPLVGEGIAYAGFPLGLQLLNSTQTPTYSEGVIGAQLRSHSLRKEIQITGAVAEGFSGSPIVLKNDPAKVLGVLSHSPLKEAGDANIFLAVSWEHIKALAELTKS